MDEPTRLTLTCRDVPAGVSFFRDVLALPVRQRDPSFAEVRLGRYTAALEPPSREYAAGEERPPGAILQIEVDDVPTAVSELRRRGATVLMDDVRTEWGTRSAFVAGPDDLLVELYQPRHEG